MINTIHLLRTVHENIEFLIGIGFWLLLFAVILGYWVSLPEEKEKRKNDEHDHE